MALLNWSSNSSRKTSRSGTVWPYYDFKASLWLFAAWKRSSKYSRNFSGRSKSSQCRRSFSIWIRLWEQYSSWIQKNFRWIWWRTSEISSGSRCLRWDRTRCGSIRRAFNSGGNDQRISVPLSKLNVGLKCGGSDGLSGITANPLLGAFSDYLIAQGGSTILTEVPEMFGAEQVLMARAENEEVFDSIVDLINDFKQYFLSYGNQFTKTHLLVIKQVGSLH